MLRFSLPLIFYIVAGCAGYFALYAITIHDESSLTAWFVNSLGVVYGTLLYFCGCTAFYVSCRSAWRSTTASEVAIALPFTFLPALIGLIAFIHEMIVTFQIVGNSTVSPMLQEVYVAHSLALACLLVGLCLSAVPFAILSIAMVVKHTGGATGLPSSAK